MLLSDVENMLRQDLFDTGATRWANSDIDRAIDKAVDHYSQYYPNIVFTDMQMQPYQRTYPYPTSWNAAYPVLWIEKILYPLQVYGSQFAAPASAPLLSSATGTTPAPGTYQYLVTFLTQGGETTGGPASSITTSSGNQKINLSAIPIAPAQTIQPAIATNTVIGRNIYRTQAGGNVFYYLATLGDNTTTVYSDSALDSTLSNMPQVPSINTSGVMVWPVYERSFSEYSNMYDSSSSLAAGGNMGLMGAIGDSKGPSGTQAPSFTLALNSAELPKDNSLSMRVFYATKQQLDANGSTIPELHRDIIISGACAYCLEAYQIPTNDNFTYQDGGLRDHIDDTHIPESFAAAAKNKMDQFTARLQEVKQQRDFASSARAHWGEIAIGWTRL